MLDIFCSAGFAKLILFRHTAVKIDVPLEKFSANITTKEISFINIKEKPHYLLSFFNKNQRMRSLALYFLILRTNDWEHIVLYLVFRVNRMNFLLLHCKFLSEIHYIAFITQGEIFTLYFTQTSPIISLNLLLTSITRKFYILIYDSFTIY